MIYIIWGKKVIFLCGLIASGKTTYAIKNHKNYTDLDMMHPYAQKKHQISWTKKLLEVNKEVCHITCYPTDEELAAFEEYNDIEFLWLDTTLGQAKVNMLLRNRERDIIRFNSVLEANDKYQSKFKKSDLNFKLVK